MSSAGFGFQLQTLCFQEAPPSQEGGSPARRDASAYAEARLRLRPAWLLQTPPRSTGVCVSSSAHCPAAAQSLSHRRLCASEEFEAHARPVSCLALGKSTGRLLATGGEDCRVNLWSLNKANCIMVRAFILKQR